MSDGEIFQFSLSFEQFCYFFIRLCEDAISAMPALALSLEATPPSVLPLTSVDVLIMVPGDFCAYSLSALMGVVCASPFHQSEACNLQLVNIWAYPSVIGDIDLL